jgi:hypothetical protein
VESHRRGDEFLQRGRIFLFRPPRAMTCTSPVLLRLSRLCHVALVWSSQPHNVSQASAVIEKRKQDLTMPGAMTILLCPFRERPGSKSRR